MAVNMAVMILLLVGLVGSAVVCAFLQNLLKSCIALSVVSGILAVIMFLLGANLAAVFELSVCSGLVTVVFISAVSMTRLHTKEEIAEKEKTRRKRFVFLPVLLIVLFSAALYILWPYLNAVIPYAGNAAQVSEADVFWNKRQADLLGQIVIVLAGIFGVLIFFKEREQE